MFEYVRPSGEKLKAAYDFINSLFGSRITPYQDVVAMQAKNDGFIHAIFNTQSGAVEGYFSIIPLTPDAEKQVGSNMLAGSNITPDHMAYPSVLPAGYYLGAVAAKDCPKARFATMRYLMKYMDTLDKSKPLYTRPLTKDGQRLCGRLDFSPLPFSAEGQAGPIYKYSA